MGWTEKINKVLDQRNTVWSVYSRLLYHQDLPYENNLSIEEMIKEINNHLQLLEDVTIDDFNFKKYYDSKRPYVTLIFF